MSVRQRKGCAKSGRMRGVLRRQGSTGRAALRPLRPGNRTFPVRSEDGASPGQHKRQAGRDGGNGAARPSPLGSGARKSRPRGTAGTGMRQAFAPERCREGRAAQFCQLDWQKSPALPMEQAVPRDFASGLSRRGGRPFVGRNQPERLPVWAGMASGARCASGAMRTLWWGRMTVNVLPLPGALLTSM